MKKAKHQYTDDMRVRAILETKPQTLAMFGIDPVQLKKEMLAADQKIAQIEEEFESKIKKEFEAAWRGWIQAYKTVLTEQGITSDRKPRMDQANPAFVLRNHLMELAI